ncbi:MAG: formate dehydrogenase, partial [Deltaproteobacteria bacterium]|nr:formate dehydrogenase [Deltaproteobacteria bacterium]
LEPASEIQPADADARGLDEGQKVRLLTPRGEIVMPLRFSRRPRPGSVILAWGWGEVDDRFNLNNLTDDSRRDPVTATPANRGFFCRLEKLQG